MKCNIQGTKYTIANIYAPNYGQSTFLSNSLDDLNSFAQGLITFCGDLNLALLPTLDSSGGSSVAFSKLNKIKKLFHSLQLCDSWRLTHPNDLDYSFYSHPQGVYTRIYYIFLLHPLLANLSKSSIGNILHCDHAPIHCDLTLLNSHRKPFSWQLNKTLLSDSLCLSDLQLLKTLLDHASDPSFSQIQWKSLKCVLR